MAMNTNNEQLKTKLTFDDQVIKKIAGITANQVEGVISLDGNVFSELTDRFTPGSDTTKGIDADVGEQQVSLKLDATIEYGKNATQIFKEVLAKVKQALKEMTGLTLVEFELHINDVKTKAELKDENNSKE
ncbi:Asp23/Gls24 family envelope stress response protein [Liquorilactobacillus uvarum]|uniref:Asp23/Gls24 family envelope stress response protein n=1 Tax=Liquorilactobacillus uvarum TaxID=303240 RepID=UPI0028891BE2|nr:Asp23/Gls24 family envelope stress response protein [Liquorilactobacillus uvarum]